MIDPPNLQRRPVLRAMTWGAIAAGTWLVGAFVVSGALGYFYGWNGGSYLGNSPPGWKAAEDRALLMTIFGWLPLSPVAFLAGCVASRRRRAGGKPPVGE